tara:strand:- start:621 stop:803 length:183 start_codon:yes stop_codon:yes gene_type:complete
VPQPVNNLPADLIQPCPDLRQLSGTTGKEVTLWAVDTANKYTDCKARHSALVEAVSSSDN